MSNYLGSGSQVAEKRVGAVQDNSSGRSEEKRESNIADASFRVLPDKMVNVEMSIPVAMLTLFVVFCIGIIFGLLLRNDAEAKSVFALSGVVCGLVSGWILRAYSYKIKLRSWKGKGRWWKG